MNGKRCSPLFRRLSFRISRIYIWHCLFRYVSHASYSNVFKCDLSASPSNVCELVDEQRAATAIAVIVFFYSRFCFILSFSFVRFTDTIFAWCVCVRLLVFVDLFYVFRSPCHCYLYVSLRNCACVCALVKALQLTNRKEREKHTRTLSTALNNNSVEQLFFHWFLLLLISLLCMMFLDSIGTYVGKQLFKIHLPCPTHVYTR